MGPKAIGDTWLYMTWAFNASLQGAGVNFANFHTTNIMYKYILQLVLISTNTNGQIRMQIYFILNYFHLQCLYSSDSKSLCCLSVPCHRFLSSLVLLIGGHTDCDFTVDSFDPCCMLSPWTKTWSWVMCTSCKLHSKNLVSWAVVQVCHWCTCWPPSHLAPTACLHENRP